MSEQLAEISQLQCLGRLSTGPGCFICSGKSRPPLSSPPACRPLTRRPHKSGDRQCPHFGSRTGPYQCRTGPDCGGFRGSGEYSGAGTRFVSHLGHVFSLFRGLWAAECVQISFYGPLRGPIFVGGRCCGWVAPSLGLDSGVAAYSFMAGSAWNCMTC